MRLRALVIPALLVPALIALGACGASGATESQSSDISSSDAPAATTSGTHAAAGPELPPDTEIAPAVPRDQLPEVSGKFGEKPTITPPTTPAPDSLQRVILSQGDGTEVKAGDTAVVNYLGQVWGGEVFDNSFDRGSPYAAQIGGERRTVVVGWDVGLRGVKAGSRVLLSFPARDGYGAQGSGDKIPGGASLVFVVDVVDVYAVDVAGQVDATPQEVPDGWPTVGGDLGGVPTVKVPATLPEPAQAGGTLVAKGTGEPVQPGEILVQYAATSWDGSFSEQSWPDATGAIQSSGTGPQSFPISADSPFASMLGMPIGSRVLLRTPPDSKSGVPAFAWVIDLIAQKNVTSAG